jgi:hypothetical protein
VIDAKLRRTTIATARRTPMAITRPRPASTVEVETPSSSNRGRITSSITRPIAKLDATVNRAKTAAPPIAATNSLGCTLTISTMKPALRRVRCHAPSSAAGAASSEMVSAGCTARFYQPDPVIS